MAAKLWLVQRYLLCSFGFLLICSAYLIVGYKCPFPAFIQQGFCFVRMILRKRKCRKTLKYNVIRQFLIVVYLWCHRESNQGHKDFQSFALPSEL